MSTKSDKGTLSETDSPEFGDENHLFYDEGANTKTEIKLTLEAFDRDNGGLSNVYQERFLPRLKDKTSNFTKWLIDTGLLSSSVSCPNTGEDPKCAENMMEFVPASDISDCYVLRCKNCSRKESARIGSIFYGLKCNLRSVIRVLYGWVKGADLELMANMLGLHRDIVGTIYNRAAKIALSCMSLCPGLGEFGGEGTVVLVDIYPDLLKNFGALKKGCRPILCISEIESIPQKYWLEPLEYWDKTNPKEVQKIRAKVTKLVLSLVKPGSILILPNDSTLPFEDDDSLESFYRKYNAVKYVDDLVRISTQERPFARVLDTIWKYPVTVCEQAQYFNPDYVSQFMVKHLWSEMTDKFSFIMLMTFIVNETKMNNMETYF